MANTPKLSAAQQRVVDHFLEAHGQKFRRQDIAEALYPHIRPRLMGNATRLADVIVRQLQAAGKLEKAGHVHWKLVSQEERTLKSGRQARELANVVDLPLTTRCPEKWVTIDLETGEVREGSAQGWKRASADARRDAAAILSSEST